MGPTVIEYVLLRLKKHGVTDVFGVPGDFAYPILDGILDDQDIEWRGSCNELNGGYSADGYARIKGLGAVVSTYVAGELSLVNALGEDDGRSPAGDRECCCGGKGTERLSSVIAAHASPNWNASDLI
jgi:hypothetical protein